MSVILRDVKDTLRLVERACDGVDGLQAAIVFGSALVTDEPHDLDLALLWSEDVSAGERWRRANRVAGDIEHAMGAAALNVDVKDLRALPLVLQHRVLQSGRSAYVADRRALVRFNSETVPRALDFLPFYRRMLEASAERLGGK